MQNDFILTNRHRWDYRYLEATFDFVEARFDFVAKNSNNAEQV